MTHPLNLKYFKKSLTQPKEYVILRKVDTEDGYTMKEYETITTTEPIEVLRTHYPRHFGYIVKDTK